MSVVMSVFLRASNMPSPADWAQAIEAAGFEMALDTDFDPATFSGFLPCQYQGENAGFEFFWEPANHAELGDDIASRIGDRDSIVNLVTHSGLRELMTSIIAAAVLCVKADGVLWDTEANECISADKALAWGKSAEAGIRHELEVPRGP